VRVHQVDSKTYDGWVLTGRRIDMYLTPNSELPIDELVVHETAHIICWIAWRNSRHGEQFKQVEKQLAPAGSHPQAAPQPILPPAGL
jgi:predicted SprT family Zn-dependent metalloprotease